MILGFKPQFKQLILDGTKIHSIRVDQHKRWKPGMKIHFATGVRTKNYEQFKEGLCVSVQELRIEWDPSTPMLHNIFIDGKRQGPSVIYDLAVNDGFINPWYMVGFFIPASTDRSIIKPLRIIHWTYFRYE